MKEGVANGCGTLYANRMECFGESLLLFTKLQEH